MSLREVLRSPWGERGPAIGRGSPCREGALPGKDPRRAPVRPERGGGNTHRERSGRIRIPPPRGSRFRPFLAAPGQGGLRPLGFRFSWGCPCRPELFLVGFESTEAFSVDCPVGRSFVPGRERGSFPVRNGLDGSPVGFGGVRASRRVEGPSYGCSRRRWPPRRRPRSPRIFSLRRAGRLARRTRGPPAGPELSF